MTAVIAVFLVRDEKAVAALFNRSKRFQSREQIRRGGTQGGVLASASAHPSVLVLWHLVPVERRNRPTLSAIHLRPIHAVFAFAVQRRVRSWWILLPLAAVTWVLSSSRSYHLRKPMRFTLAT